MKEAATNVDVWCDRLIADAMGRSDLIPNVISYMEASFAYWVRPPIVITAESCKTLTLFEQFETGSAILPGYETNWGGIVNNQGATNVNVDFGNG